MQLIGCCFIKTYDRDTVQKCLITWGCSLSSELLNDPAYSRRSIMSFMLRSLGRATNAVLIFVFLNLSTFSLPLSLLFYLILNSKKLLRMYISLNSVFWCQITVILSFISMGITQILLHIWKRRISHWNSI